MMPTAQDVERATEVLRDLERAELHKQAATLRAMSNHWRMRQRASWIWSHDPTMPTRLAELSQAIDGVATLADGLLDHQRGRPLAASTPPPISDLWGGASSMDLAGWLTETRTP